MELNLQENNDQQNLQENNDQLNLQISATNQNLNLSATVQNLQPSATNQNLHLSATSQNEYGSFHCAKFKPGKKCDTCKHMTETNFVESKYFKVQGDLYLACEIF